MSSFLTLNTNSNALAAKLPYSSRCQTIASTLKIWSFKTLVLNSVTAATPAELEHAPPAPDHSSAFPCPPPPLPGARPRLGPLLRRPGPCSVCSRGRPRTSPRSAGHRPLRASSDPRTPLHPSSAAAPNETRMGTRHAAARGPPRAPPPDVRAESLSYRSRFGHGPRAPTGRRPGRSRALGGPA